MKSLLANGLQCANRSDNDSNNVIPSETDAWLTAAEAASYLRCSVKTLYNYKCEGKITANNRGGTKRGALLFKKCVLDNFITGKKR